MIVILHKDEWYEIFKQIVHIELRGYTLKILIPSGREVSVNVKTWDNLTDTKDLFSELEESICGGITKFKEI